MEYVDVETAKQLSGVRIALTARVPGPWSESAKAVLTLRNVPFVAVAQEGGGDNPELVDWSRHRNAPVVMYDDEAPRVRWLEIVELAERIGRGDSLLPERLEERMAMVGLVNEIAGESGFAWQGRLLMLEATYRAQGEAVLSTPLFKSYYSSSDAAAAITYIQSFLDYLASTIRAQQALGSPYLIGNQFSAADVYWAYFSQLLSAYPPEKNPMPEFLRKSWGVVADRIGEFDPILLAQRDQIFNQHLTLPMDF